MLIIECDANKLESQGMAMGADLSANRAWRLLGFEVEYVCVRRARDLDVGLKRLGRKRHHAIVVIGHSNSTLLQLAPGELPEWQAVGRRLARFRPDRMLMIACEAGAPDVAEALFSSMSSLRRIYGSPIRLTHANAQRVLTLATYLLGPVEIPEAARLLLQGAHMLWHDGLFFELRREDFTSQERREQAQGRAALAVLAHVVLAANKPKRCPGYHPARAAAQTNTRSLQQQSARH